MLLQFRELFGLKVLGSELLPGPEVVDVPVPRPGHRLQIRQKVLREVVKALGLGLGLVELGSGLAPKRRRLVKFRPTQVVRFPVAEEIVVWVEIWILKPPIFLGFLKQLELPKESSSLL